ncbi:MAG TPA: DNA-directed RNA polymerase subunit alpha C-terminal domain-containing protein [Sedimentisphaerales bacterium]|nr:DNA-directed RNA polymerase subunit alpha C-terminal domain-containing protein [Sedimentisphaerales bacterium]
MEPITEPGIDLFAENLPSMDEIKRLSEFVHSGEANLLKFGEKVESNMGGSEQQACLAVGIGLYILGRNAEAVEKLQKANDCKEKYIYLAFALRRIREFEKAIENLQKSLDYEADTLSITLEKTDTYRHARDFDAAAKELKACKNFENVSAEYHYQLGRLQEVQGLYEEAMDNYKTALELSPNHQRALFHLAFRYDLSGDEEAAIDYYRQIASSSPVYVNALLNLTVLYEDNSQYDKAAKCVDMVLETHPNHQRAILFNKDIESSKTMFYDEEKEEKKTRKTQILETPISDFELSVRSRNCLKKMRIHTLGDLLNITEVELLSYKNFGETSLREIKSILEPKGLTLGMALEAELMMPSVEISDQAVAIDEDEGLRNKPVDDLQLSVRARKCVQKLNLRTIGELTHKTEAELLGCKNFGVTSLNEIKKSLTNLGLSLRSLD